MTKEKFLQDYEVLVERNERAARNMEESVLHIHAQMDDLMDAIHQVDNLKRGFAFPLNQTGIQLLSQDIHKMIEEYEQQQENGFEPGVRLQQEWDIVASRLRDSWSRC